MYIICVYDVKEKRCQKFMKLLRKYLFHVQNSVFEGTLTPKQYRSLRQEIDTLLNSDEDSVINALIEKKADKIIISCQNCGCSISKDEEKKIFDMFYRSDASRNNNTGGSGIGLAISKKIVELHKGKIYAECREGIFTIKVVLNRI